MSERIRLDKWLWAARFYKTRSLATQEIDKGRVALNGERAKPARDVKAGDRLDIERDGLIWQIEVLAVSGVRGPAPVAQTLYRETEVGRQKRLDTAERRKLMREPAEQIHGRPTKRDRRALDRTRPG